MHVSLEGPFRSSYEIVGIVKDARYFGLRDGAEPMMFVPVWRRFAEQRALVIRTSGSASNLGALLRREVHQLDPAIPLLNVHSLEQDVDQSILVERLVATLSGFFGLLELLLSAVGLYGVVSYTVTRRTREIGVRIALGAARRSILLLIVADVITMLFLGALIGIAAAFLMVRAIGSMSYGVGSADPLSIVAAGLCLIVAAALASLFPARRVVKIDPIAALRYE
jgi:ABC-type antimicrobial peptide transport system permease subunit